jgi:hypothetical protein
MEEATMSPINRKVMAFMAVLILALGTIAPFAEAGNAYGRRWKKKGRNVRVVRVERSYPSHTYIVRRSDNFGPVLAGFVGGLILGAVLTDRASGHAVYRDPYCDRPFYSRASFDDHCRTYHRSREVRVVQYSSSQDYYDDCDRHGYYEGEYERYRDRDYRDRDYRDRDRGYDDYGD